MRAEHSTKTTEIRLVTLLEVGDDGRVIVKVVSELHGNATRTALGQLVHEDGVWRVESNEHGPSYGKTRREALESFVRGVEQLSARFSVR